MNSCSEETTNILIFVVLMSCFDFRSTYYIMNDLFFQNGALKIIDRKKNIIKLAQVALVHPYELNSNKGNTCHINTWDE